MMIKSMMKRWVIKATEKPLSGIMSLLFSGGILIGEAYKITVGPEKQNQL